MVSLSEWLMLNYCIYIYIKEKVLDKTLGVSYKQIIAVSASD